MSRRAGGRAARAAGAPDPFAALGLPARADVTDDDVRAAWRRIAAATHPDRDDGGSPRRFAEAAAAYATLRTAFGRGEALADLAETAETAETVLVPGRRRRRFPVAGWAPEVRTASARWLRWLPRLMMRLLAVAAVAAAGSEALGWSPGLVGILAGTATWLIAFLRRTLWREPRRAARRPG